MKVPPQSNKEELFREIVIFWVRAKPKIQAMTFHWNTRELELKRPKGIYCAFGIGLKNPTFFLIFSLFLLLFIGLIALFGTIHKSYYNISATF